MSKKHKYLIGLIISVTLILLILIPSIAASDGKINGVKAKTVPSVTSKTGEISSKEEVVYGTLNSDGEPQGIYVINILDVIATGNIIDYGEYNSIKNLANLHNIDLKDDSITTYSDIGKFYYQGNMKTNELPWKISIKYFLDGKEISAEKLAGQSGKLKMELVTEKNDIANESFYENYMLQISITLDTDKCKNIIADGGMFANSGRDKLITFTVMPNADGHALIGADVKNFTMDGTSISAVPFSMDIDLPDTDDIAKDLTTLSGAINALSEGAIQLKNGASSLATGARTLQKGSAGYKAGIEKLDKESAALIDASSQINEALSTIANMLETDMDLSGLEGLEELEELLLALTDLSVDIEEIADGLGGLLIAYQQLDSAVKKIPDSIDEKELSEFVDEHAENQIVQQLLENYRAAQEVKVVYADFKNAFESILLELREVLELLDTISGVLSKISIDQDNPLEGLDIRETIEGIAQLSSGMNELASNYSQFHEGLIAYTDGVSKLASGYGDIHSGISGIADGSDDLSGGASELSNGLAMLNDKTKDMPDLVSDMMDELMGDFDTSDYVPTSFTSDKNKNVKAVQFVLITEAIEKEKQPAITEEVKEETFWDRLKNLFKKRY